MKTFSPMRFAKTTTSTYGPQSIAPGATGFFDFGSIAIRVRDIFQSRFPKHVAVFAGQGTIGPQLNCAVAKSYDPQSDKPANHILTPTIRMVKVSIRPCAPIGHDAVTCPSVRRDHREE